jgi:hypothetical protein
VSSRDGFSSLSFKMRVLCSCNRRYSANAAAYLVTTKKGALRVMPEKTEVEQILR